MQQLIISVSLTAPCVESKETAGQDFITRVNKLTALADVFTNFHNLHMETLANMVKLIARNNSIA